MQKILLPRHLLAAAQILACAALTGCDGIQSALAPHGPAARSIANVSWVMFIGATLILALVMVLALIAILRTPGKTRRSSERLFIVGGGIIFPVVTLAVLLMYGVAQMGYLRAGDAASPVRIEVIGNRWWWDVRYFDQEGELLATAANEIHIPAGIPVTFAVTTRDVIHSFWVPNLAGKIDLIPGRFNHVGLQADQPGIFRGQCAEFCGPPHALMAFLVVAHPPAEFQSWLARQQQAAHPPETQAAVAGREAFTTRCLECHTVRGVGEAKQPGPELTRFGSRLTIGAGILENNRDNLMNWIANSQRIKPGNRMPDFAHLEKQEIADIAAWLEGLK